MCVTMMRVNSVSDSAPKFGFVPCGKCEVCRDVMKNQWSFRLRCELTTLWKLKWNIGFLTLTYSPECLPHLPKDVFKHEKDWRKNKNVACFSRSDIRTFIDNIRKRLHERYGLKGADSIRYMICSEYGSEEYTHRPHYHGIIAFPPQIPAREMFDLVHSNWNKGLIIPGPKHFDGWTDSKGHSHNGFLLQGDVGRAAHYASKYCCKDLNFYHSLPDCELLTRSKLFRDCSPIHIQSRSIGLRFLENKSERELVDILAHGVDFVGLDKKKALPVYIRDKVFFKPYYIFSEPDPRYPRRGVEWRYDFEKDKWIYDKENGTHRRLVRRECTEFFRKHYREIFEKKVDYFEQLFSDFCRADYWNGRLKPISDVHGLKITSTTMALKFSEQIARFTPRKLAEYYVAYFGVKPERCYYGDLAAQYASRYDSSFIPNDNMFVTDDFLCLLWSTVTKMMSNFRYCKTYDKAHRDLVRKIVDFYKHLT